MPLCGPQDVVDLGGGDEDIGELSAEAGWMGHDLLGSDAEDSVHDVTKAGSFFVIEIVALTPGLAGERTRGSAFCVVEIDAEPAIFVAFTGSMDPNWASLDECCSTARCGVVDMVLSSSVLVDAGEQVGTANLIGCWVGVHSPCTFESPVVDDVGAVIEDADSVGAFVAADGENVDGFCVEVSNFGSKNFGELILGEHGKSGCPVIAD